MRGLPQDAVKQLVETYQAAGLVGSGVHDAFPPLNPRKGAAGRFCAVLGGSTQVRIDRDSRVPGAAPAGGFGAWGNVCGCGTVAPVVSLAPVRLRSSAILTLGGRP